MDKPYFIKETKIEIYKDFDGKCGHCGSTQALEFHHIIPNTILNRKIYGNERIQSKENGFLICKPDHEKVNIILKEKRKALKQKWNAEINQQREEILLQG